jgi:hypothetical protein
LFEEAHVMMWNLEVGRSEFLDALRRIVPKSSKETPHARVVLTFSDSHLSVESIGGKVQIPATGTWPGAAAVSADLLKRLTRALPEEDPLRLQATGNQFTISRLFLPCECHANIESTPQFYGEMIPANLTLHEMLKLCEQYQAEAIEAAGLAPGVAAAQQKVESILRRAATVLQLYGVTEGELMELVEKHAADTSCAFQDADKGVIKRIAEAWTLLAPLGIEAGEIKALVDESIRNAWKR